MQSRENKILSACQNGVCGCIGFYFEGEDIRSQGAEFGGHRFITFRQKLRPEPSQLSSHIYNNMRSAETLLTER